MLKLERTKLTEKEQKIYDAVVNDPIAMSWIYFSRKNWGAKSKCYEHAIYGCMAEKEKLLDIQLNEYLRLRVLGNILMEVAGF